MELIVFQSGLWVGLGCDLRPISTYTQESSKFLLIFKRNEKLKESSYLEHISPHKLIPTNKAERGWRKMRGGIHEQFVHIHLKHPTSPRQSHFMVLNFWCNIPISSIFQAMCHGNCRVAIQEE